MNKDEIKGKAKDITGRAQRQAGEWTGDEKSQAEGAKKQVEGKVQEQWGKIKDAAEQAKEDMARKREVKRENKPAEAGTEEEREEGEVA